MANKKSFVVAAIIGAAALSTILLKKLYKKELKSLNEAKEAEDKKIEELGISPEIMREQVLETGRPEDQNMVNAAFVGIAFNSNWEEEVIDIDRAMDVHSKILHITETHKRGVKYLDLLFEIPEYSKNRGSFNELRVGDYYTAMNQLRQILKDEIVRFCEKPRGKMGIYLAYSYSNPNRRSVVDPENITNIVEVPEEIWSKWKDDQHDGVVEFFEDAEENGIYPACKKKGLGKAFEKLISEDIDKKAPNLETVVTPHPEELKLMYKISFREAGEDGIGMSVKCLLDSLKYIYDEFIISRKGRDERETEMLKKRGVRYTNFMFHAPNEKGEFDSLTRYYMVGPGHRVFTNTYSFPGEDEE